MRSFVTEKDMPIGELPKEDGTVHHLICKGSRRHTISYGPKGEKCSVPNCEINNRYSFEKR